MSEPIHIISLGAGVQSSTMALMAAAGEITPMPKCAIFADTQDEPQSVYEWLGWLTPRLPFPVHVVTKGKLSEQALKMNVTKDGRRYSKTDIPFFTLDSRNQIGKITARACTFDFKLSPLFKESKKIAGIKRGQKTVGVIQWIGISVDEISRCKPSREKWAQSRWPIMELRMNRNDCISWMKKRGFPLPPRSACVFCPYHNNAEWRRLKKDEPAEFEKAVQFEKAVGKAKRQSSNFDCVPYLHRSCKPLSEIDFSTEEERGQGWLWGQWSGECEGMCGV